MVGGCEEIPITMDDQPWSAYKNDHLCSLDEEIEHEGWPILFSNAISNPETVVIEGGYTDFARFAVLGSDRLIDVAYRAVVFLQVAERSIESGFIGKPSIQ